LIWSGSSARSSSSVLDDAGGRLNRTSHSASVNRMRAYTALIFDLFDTLIDFRRDRMPLIQGGGTEARSTSRHVYDRFKTVCADVPFEAFYAAFMDGYREAERIRARDWREITSEDRFRLVLSKLQVAPDDVPADFPEAGRRP